jgi:serine/threonine-protein kinase
MPLVEPNQEELSESAEQRIGDIVDGRYRLEGVLGIGGLGVVYRAEHTGLRRQVALKLMHELFADHDELRQRFEREARALSALDHPNIVAISDFGTHVGTPYLAMSLIEGDSLSQRLANGPLPIAEAIEIVRQALEALVSAHAAGVVHRDLKPGNIMLDTHPDGALRVRIVDFGLARMADPRSDGVDDATITRLGTVIGSPSYMAPEQTTASATDGRADLYALGIVLYEMLVGRCPFVNEDKLVTLRSHLTTDVPRPESLRPGLRLTPELEALLDKALEKGRDERFASAEEMRDALERLPSPAGAAPGESPPSERPEPPEPRPTAPTRRHPHIALVFGIGALALVGLGVAGAILISLASSFSDESPEGEAHDDFSDGSEADDDGMMVFDEDDLPPLGRPPPVDPLAEGDVPSELRRPLALVRAGAPLDRAQQRELLEYQGSHMDDPRASLILAHDYASQHWYRDTVNRYAMVHRIDPTARGNPWMRDDLIAMIGAPSHGPSAMRAIRRIYGAEAIPPLEARLAETSDPRERARISQLLEQLR